MVAMVAHGAERRSIRFQQLQPEFAVGSQNCRVKTPFLIADLSRMPLHKLFRRASRACGLEAQRKANCHRSG